MLDPRAIPNELVQLLQERRIIPFVGAGFSAGLGLPSWNELLKTIANDTEGVPPFDEISTCCDGDYLRIAEYLFIKHNKQIGPIRQILTQRTTLPPLTCLSSCHIELINLNASQVYTTNYDDAIETVFKHHRLNPQVVATSRHIATTDGKRPQIVKFHGDPRDERTLVLTESSYYDRLDFETPMDLKFRSDLLGKGVLFMGYSFRDVNIRVIWYRLMKMMSEIAREDRTPSYIVQFSPNAVRDTLLKDVGLQPIVIDPEGKATTDEDRCALFEEFMLTLSSLVVSKDRTSPGTNRRALASPALLRIIRRGLKAFSKGALRTSARVRSDLVQQMGQLALRDVPDELLADASTVLAEVQYSTTLTSAQVAIACSRLYARFDGRPELTAAFLAAYLDEEARSAVAGMTPDQWQKVWSHHMPLAFSGAFVGRLERMVDPHYGGYEAQDRAVAADMLARIGAGMILSNTDPSRLRARATLQELQKHIPQLKDHVTANTTEPISAPFFERLSEYFEGSEAPF